jgi:AcrR family transcriptional regulator
LPAPVELPTLGLRERKKAKTRAAIQACALRLFRERGYDHTTVGQIAAAAEVSESTFFRYFPTKAEVVLWDEFDPLIAREFRNQPGELSPIGALRGAFRAAFSQLSPKQLDEQREQTQLIMTVDELRAAMLDQLAQAMGLLADLAAERSGRRTNDIKVRTFAGAVVGAAMAVAFAIADDPTADFATLLDDALAQLEAGLAL